MTVFRAWIGANLMINHSEDKPSDEPTYEIEELNCKYLREWPYTCLPQSLND
jgi:hypothetical protein